MYKWAATWDFQQCGRCTQQRLWPACAYAQSDQSICWSLEYSMSLKLLTEHHLESLSLNGGWAGSSESTLVKNNTLLEIKCRCSFPIETVSKFWCNQQMWHKIGFICLFQHKYLWIYTYDNITYATLYSPRMRRSNYQPWQTADSRRDIGNRE